jgi:hypothetical protein
MMADNIGSDYSSGNYDAAIVAIAIGDDADMEIDASSDDVGFDDIISGISSAIDDADIDHEETWLRRCTGDIPDGIETNPKNFGSLPPELQMKLVLDLREREKATLLVNLQECSSVVDRLKEQLYESEDKRMDLEHELDTENTEVEEMKREFEEMKEAHKCRINDIERITNEMLVQRERLSKMIEQQQRSSSTVSSDSPVTLPCSSDDSESSPQEKSGNDNSKIDLISPGVLGEITANETTKSKIEMEFEHKLQTNPQYREEFERFKEFQVHYQASTRNHQHQTSSDGSSDGKDLNTTPPWGEEYRKMLEFQLVYERILSFAAKKKN